MRVRRRSLVLVLCGLGLSGCLGSTSGGDLLPRNALQARCRYGATQTTVLVTEWSASDKADLEALLSEGRGVAVAFSGCQMRVLPQCRLHGRYVWQRTTPSADTVEIKSEADLYSKLPLGAANLEGELKRSRELSVQTTVSGQKRLVELASSEVPPDGACAEATHVVNALSLGAFVMTAGGEQMISASAEVEVVKAGGKRTRSAKIVRAAGDATTCAAAGDLPAAGCASPIQVFLAPIPGRAEPLGPPGTVKADFVSGSTTTRWDVYIDDQATCTTPCSRWVDPSRPVDLRTRDLPDRLRVGFLDGSQGPLQVSAEPKSFARWSAGVTFTSLAGMGVAAGITLAAIGCSGDSAGMCTGGLITFGASSVALAGAIWLLLDAGPKVHVRPLFGTEVSARIGPGFVTGSF